MLSPSQPLPEHPGRENMAKLLFAAMQRDVDGQRGLIRARTRGETEAVFWDDRGGYLSPEEERRRLGESIQCTLLQIGLTTEGIRVQIVRSKVLLGLN